MEVERARNLNCFIPRNTFCATSSRGWETMCSDRDCRIFRGMIIACDGCEKMARTNTGMQPASMHHART